MPAQPNRHRSLHFPDYCLSHLTGPSLVLQDRPRSGLLVGRLCPDCSMGEFSETDIPHWPMPTTLGFGTGGIDTRFLLPDQPCHRRRSCRLRGHTWFRQRYIRGGSGQHTENRPSGNDPWHLRRLRCNMEQIIIRSNVDTIS